MKHILLILCTTFFLATLSAQKAPIKWGKIDPADLQMTDYPLDPEADAVVLCDYGTINFNVNSSGASYNFRRIRRIKILKASAFDRGNISISYYKGRRNTFSLKAQVFQPDGSVYTVQKKDIIDENIYDDYYERRIALPNITEGCIIEYRSDLTSFNYTFLPTWYFQEDIPVRWSELRMNIPGYFEYVRLFQGQENLKISDSEIGTMSIGGRMMSVAKSRYAAEHVPALKEEAYVTTMEDYLMRIRFQLSMLNVPGQLPEPFMEDWTKVAQELMKADFFGQQFTKLKRIAYIQKILAADLAGKQSPAEKIAFLHAYLAKNIEWNGDYTFVADNDVDEVFDKRIGSSAEINLLLLALLRENGIDAYPMLVSTRGHGKVVPIYPFLSQFNHMMVYTELDGKPMYLDVGSPTASANLPRVSALNKEGLLIKSDTEAKWIPIVPQRSKNIYMVDMNLDEEGIIDTKIQCSHSGYGAVRQRLNYAKDVSGAYWVNNMEDAGTAVDLAKFEYSNLDEVGKSFKGAIECSLPSQAQVVDDFIYLSPIFHSIFQDNPFKSEKRSFPVEIPYPLNEQYIINLTLPEGYTLEDKPDNIKLSIPNKGGRFTYSISEAEAGKLQIVMRTNINQTYFTPEQYEGLKSFYDILSEKLQEQIVLKRAD